MACRSSVQGAEVFSPPAFSAQYFLAGVLETEVKRWTDWYTWPAPGPF